MSTRTRAIAGESARSYTASPRWSPSQQSELSALQSGQWWPFQKADAKVLAYLHKKEKTDQNPLSDMEDALL